MVLDASGAVELLLGTRRGRRLAARITSEGAEPLATPQLADVEIASALRRLARRGELDAGRAARAIGRWQRLDIERFAHTPLLPRIWQLRENASAYDACYLALAEALQEPLVTADRGVAANADRLSLAFELI